MPLNEFQEIGHCGGKVTFRVITSPTGQRQYQVAYAQSSPLPAALFAVWALPQGAPVADIEMGGIGTPWNPPPVPGCYPVMIASDSQGKFGHQCPSCRRYWRSDGGAVMCPYCGARAERYMFLTEAQRRYVAQYCARMNLALSDDKDGEHVIDMDAVAAAVGQGAEKKPEFYYAEESQQKSFECEACGGFNDVIGKYCYCSRCGTRNDLHELTIDTLARIRHRINSEGDHDACISDVVNAFDMFVAQYVRQLVQRVPLSSARKARLERMRFHNLRTTAAELRAVFDIDILDGVKPEDVAFGALMFHRRHVYEHNGGVVDEKYIADSGDTSVRLGQSIRETQESAHRLTGLVAKMAENLHGGFHDIFPPDASAIVDHARRTKSRA